MQEPDVSKENLREFRINTEDIFNKDGRYGHVEWIQKVDGTWELIRR
jgi:hypothetical protein